MILDFNFSNLARRRVYRVIQKYKLIVSVNFTKLKPA